LELYCIEAHRFFQGLEKWAPPIMSRRNNVKIEENAFSKIADERPLLKLIFPVNGMLKVVVSEKG